MTPLDRAHRVVGGLLFFFCGFVAQANRHGKYSNPLLTFVTLTFVDISSLDRQIDDE